MPLSLRVKKSKLVHRVVVSGSTLYETEDGLIAYAVKSNYLAIGWKDVSVKSVRVKTLNNGRGELCLVRL
jgi:hypothetical protein